MYALHICRCSGQHCYSFGCHTVLLSTWWNPRDFDFMKLYLGRHFDIHDCPLSSAIKYRECPSSLIWLLVETEGWGNMTFRNLKMSNSRVFAQPSPPPPLPYPRPWANHWKVHNFAASSKLNWRHGWTLPGGACSDVAQKHSADVLQQSLLPTTPTAVYDTCATTSTPLWRRACPATSPWGNCHHCC